MFLHAVIDDVLRKVVYSDNFTHSEQRSYIEP